ncbi:Glycosyl transferase, family 25 and Glycosyl transferase, family 14-containing protein [Strongyloides ratti]|uniref:Glycosyl transferase, family 25 and Glycosyl transferase, family 14-containing protein n=1 Tax=Strongyloides ratti TaxID=34506 RepID=A0A090N0B6_STRRB|nr:Glycosyl transferase, family 25 and Glycosyl transferase, family 14-containing protein [Strongyloides ratti]CEF70402.1 Glycosyl transferase, family 25 and Glycosyl transferase, family 14-containing protein [Strongyloides ratti]
MFIIFLILYNCTLVICNSTFNLNSQWNPNNMKLKCDNLFKNKNGYIKKMVLKRYGEIFIPRNLSMNCKDIKSRGYYSTKAYSNKEEKFPIAFARNVHKDYAVVELMLLASYAPQNHYCFNVDIKNVELLNKVKQLAHCFDNVYVAEKQYDMNSSGKGGVKSHYECMKKLINKNWKYILLLQTDDLLIKTNRELVDILTTFNEKPLFTLHRHPTQWQRYDYNISWSYKNIKIFHKDDPKRKNKKLMEKNIKIHVGFVGSAFSRPTIEYIIKNLTIENFINMTDKDYYGVDEIVWPTLLLNNPLLVPNRIDPSCIKKILNDGDIIKYVRRLNPSDILACKSHSLHHSICDLGIENLSELMSTPNIIAYRIRPQFDYGAFYCWEEFLYKKMHSNIYRKQIPLIYRNRGTPFYGKTNKYNKPIKCR